jgi:hypothetical protein
LISFTESKDKSSQEKVTEISGKNLKIADFCYDLILDMTKSKDLKPELQHDIMVFTLILFSKIVPPASLNQELEM